ncbi:MAG: Trk system potassium transporter TrkA, partial [Rhodospirillales bacterium]|nr:Trk system potassium transporter TrkA [Rhodospirillales bacterium]
PLIPTGNDQMLPEDEVYFVVDSGQVTRAMSAFGQEQTEARRLLIFGGGNIGLFLAQDIDREHAWVNAKLIESDPARATKIAGLLDRTIVLNGDVLDPELLEEANVQSTETVVAVTNDDETNILASLLAKRYGCKRAITLVNKSVYEPLVGSLGVDVAVNPRNITVSTILQHVRRGRIHSVHTLREGFGELIEAEALETSDLVGTPLRDIDLPQGVLLGAIVRGEEVIVPRGDTIIQAKDRVVLFATSKSVQKVEKMFSVQLEYF